MKKSGPKTQVAGTNDFSIHSKYSIVAKGYVNDPFLHKFVEKSTIRSPIINRGYYVRHRAIDYGFGEAFINEPQNINVVVSLGAGFDTSALRYPNVIFIELDYPSVCHRKATILIENNLLGGNVKLNKPEDEYGLILKSQRYLLIGADLRKSDKLCNFFDSNPNLLMELIGGSNYHSNQFKINDINFNASKFDYLKPKINFILFNECSLCYIEQQFADQLLQSIINSFTRIFSNTYEVSFSYLGYEMLRSKSCENDFGHFLLSHFDSLGAGILTWISEDEIEERFRNNLGFDEVKIINMKNFWRQILNDDPGEQFRINQIEPFDEWEELDNVCSSYSLTLARKNSPMSFLKPVPTVISDKVSVKCIPNRIYPDLISVFGHCSIYDQTRNRIQIFGGFGLEMNHSFDPYSDDVHKSITGNVGHRRYSNIIELQLDDQKDKFVYVNVLKPEMKQNSVSRLHSQVIRLDTNRYFLSGGRTSPSSIQQNAIVELSKDGLTYSLRIEPELNQIKESCQFKEFPNVFRHVCTRFGHGSNCLIQLGGIRNDLSNDRNFYGNANIYLFDIETSTWTEREIASLDSSRHSMAVTKISTNCILLNGGLSLNGSFSPKFAAFEILDNRECMVNSWILRNADQFHYQSSYSHRLLQINDYEVLSIGGVGSQNIENVVYRIDVRSHEIVARHRLDCPRPSLQLLHNFTCEQINCSPNRVCLLGGGGNCFSFGTHFNPISIYDFKE